VPEFVKENVVEHESADRQHRPLMTWLGSKLCGRLTIHQYLPQTQARRQGTQSDLTTPTIDVAENACAATAIIEVNCTQALPKFWGETAQHDAYVFGVDVVESISAGYRLRKLDLWRQDLRPYSTTRGLSSIVDKSPLHSLTPILAKEKRKLVITPVLNT
jgi:hypothetical protein